MQTQAAARLRPRTDRVKTEMPLSGCLLGNSPTSRRSSMAGTLALRGHLLGRTWSYSRVVIGTPCPCSPLVCGRAHLESCQGIIRRDRDKSRAPDGWRLPYRARAAPPSVSCLWFEHTHTHTHGSGHLHAVSVWQGSHPRCKPYAGQAAYACSDGQCLSSLDPHALRSDTPSDLPSDPTRAKRPKDPKVRPFFL